MAEPPEAGLDMSLDDLIAAGGGGGSKSKGKGKKGRGKGFKDGWNDWNNGRSSDKWGAGSSSDTGRGRGGKEALDMALDDLVSGDSSGKGKGKGKKGRGKSSEDGWNDWKAGSNSWGGGSSDRWGSGSRVDWGRGGSGQDGWGSSWSDRGSRPSGRDSDARDGWGGGSSRREPERWNDGRDSGRDGRGFSWGGDRETRASNGGDGWGRGTKRGHDGGDHRSTRSKLIKVTNIPSDLGKEDITDAFEAETGKILSCDMRKGVAMIRFAKAEDALKAAETFDRGELNGRIIQVTVEQQGY